MIPADRYCHSGPGDANNSILTKLSVMPFCRGVAEYIQQPQLSTTELYASWYELSRNSTFMKTDAALIICVNRCYCHVFCLGYVELPCDQS